MSKSITDIQQMYHHYRLRALGVLVLLISALAMVFFSRPLVLLFIGLAVVFHLFLLRPYQRKYETAVTAYNLEHTLCRTLDAPQVSEKAPGEITSQVILDSKLMPCRVEKNSPLLYWQIQGHRKELSIRMCDATIAQDFHLAANGKKRVHFNSGVWTHIELPSDTQKHFLLFDETSVPTPIRMAFFEENGSYETASLDDEELATKTVLYRPLNQAEQKPSIQFLQELKRLVKYTPGYVAVSVNGCHMDIFVRGRFLSRPISVSKKPDEALLEFDPFPELSYIVRLANAALSN